MNKSSPESNEIDTDRIEDKYIVPKDRLVEIKHTVESYLPPYFPEPETIYTINRSIYFDSPDLTFLKQHLSKLDNRRKIRIRCYAPNGIENHIYFVEVKSKQNGQSMKTRVQVSNTGFDAVMKNSQIPIDEDLFLTNEQLPRDDVEKHAKLINYLLLINKAQPVIDITYKRYAHQEHEDLRITMDTNVKVRPLAMIKMEQIKDLQNSDLWDILLKYGNKFSNAEDFILEIKHKQDGDLPPWLDKMLENVDADPEGFSKYVWGMAQVMQQTLHMIKR